MNQTEIKIEKGIPMSKVGRGQPLKYPFDKMEVGDSFTHEHPIKVYNTARAYGIRHNMKFSRRDNRIFRTA